jgi:hypothetical protein
MGRWDDGTRDVFYKYDLSANFNTSAPLKFGDYKFYL